MLSRLALKSAGTACGRKVPTFSVVGVRKLQTSTPSGKENEERDLVNFPRPVLLEETSPVRLGVFPESWHAKIAEKTGSSGLYVGMTTITTFLLSKEIWVIEHDFFVGIAYFIVFLGLYNKFGASVKSLLDKSVDEGNAKYDSIRQMEIDRCMDLIKEEEKAQQMATSYENLIDAKKESVALQLENAYRARLQTAYEQVKKRLDYQLETANIHRRVEQKHMVDWIINGVKKSISAKQEDEALKKCIADLKTLA